MRTRSLVISTILIFALVLTLAAIAIAADDPFVGTWKMSAAKSKFSNQAPKSYGSTIAIQNGQFRVVQDIVTAEGTSFQRSWTAKPDGKDYPVLGDPSVDTYSFTKTDSNTTNFVFRKSGIEVFKGKTVVSKDGKTSTIAGAGKDATGKSITYTIVMEKQ